jgi:hypothetical protein
MPNIPWTRVSTYNNFTPTAFSGCTLWLDAADSSSISTTSGNVTQWRDKSGNANHTTAGTGQPTYTSPFVVFGGAAQLILPLVFSTDWSIFVVARTTQTTGTSGQQWYAGAGLFDAEVSNPVNDYGMSLVGGFLATGVGSSDTTIQSASAVNTGNLFIAEFLRTSSSGLMSNIVTGGTAVTTTGPTGARTGVTRISLGALQTNINYFIGSIAEVVAFNTVVSVTQRQNVEGYLAWKWGFVSSLPANHPGARINIPIFTIPFFTSFNPLSNIASCILWLDGMDPNGTGVRPANGTTLTTWKDKSVSNFPFTSVGSSYNTTAINGNPGINIGTNFFGYDPGSGQNNWQEVFAVGIWTGGSVFNNFNGFLTTSITSDGGFGGGLLFTGDSNTTNWYTVGNTYTTPVINGTQTYTALPAASSPFQVRISSPSAVNLRGLRFGIDRSFTDRIWQGFISEVISYNTTLTTTQRQQVEGYLAQKWGLTASLPAGHPGLTQTFYSSLPDTGSLGGVTSTIMVTNKQFPSTSITSTVLNTIATYLRDYMSEFRNPSFYGYSLDGDSYRITDGGNDMYDTGNWTYPWLISGTQFTGASGSQQVFSINYASTTATTVDTDFVYVSIGYIQSAVVGISAIHPLTVLGFRTSTGTPVGFQLAGNSGADGGGTLASGILYAGDTIQGFTVHAFYRETYNANVDPSHCNLFILLGHPSWGSVFGTINSFADPVANGGNGCYFYTSGAGVSNILAIQTLLSKASGVLVTAAECQTVVQAFVNRVKLAVGF